MNPASVPLAFGVVVGITTSVVVLALAHLLCSRTRPPSAPMSAAAILVCGTVSAVAVMRWDIVTLIAMLPLLLLAAPAALIDIWEHRLPDALTLSFTGLAVALAGLPGLVLGRFAPAERGLAAAAVVGTALLVIGLTRVGSIGMGDIKLVPGLAAYLGAAGWRALAIGLLIWSLLIAVSAVLARVVKTDNPDGVTPYGPAFVLGTVGVLLLALPHPALQQAILASLST